MDVKLPYIQSYRDRHGKPRYYVRRPGVPVVPLRSKPGTPEFVVEYQGALKLASQPRPLKTPVKAGPAEHTLEWVVRQYEKSHAFTKLTPNTQRERRSILQNCIDEPFSEKDPTKFGECPIKKFEAKFLKTMRERKAKQGFEGAANNRVTAMRLLLDWAFEEDYVDKNVGRDVKQVKYVKEPFHSWMVEEIIQFMQRHPVGTKAGLALALLMFTGVRKSDVVKLSADMIMTLPDEGEVIKFEVTKLIKSTGKTLVLPILPQLRAVLDASKLGKDTFLATEYGKPFTSAGFGGWFKDRCREAGLPHCSAHGVRKFTAYTSAENGATTAQMMAVFGWDSPAMAAHYHKEANQKKLAKSAMHLMVNSGSTKASV